MDFIELFNNQSICQDKTTNEQNSGSKFNCEDLQTKIIKFKKYDNVIIVKPENLEIKDCDKEILNYKGYFAEVINIEKNDFIRVNLLNTPFIKSIKIHKKYLELPESLREFTSFTKK